MLKTYRTFKGGYKFINYENQTQPVLENLKIPSRVIILLKQGFGSQALPLVKKGESVFAGQIIARDDHAVSNPVHSSVTGIVEDIAPNSVTIRTTDFSPQIRPLKGYSADWQKLSSEKIEELIYLSGAASLSKSGIPTHFKSSIILPENVRHLIIHNTDSEAYNLSLELLFEGGQIDNFLQGVKILKKILPETKIHFAIDAGKRKLIRRIAELSSQLNWFNIYPVEPKYPLEYEEILLPAILKEKFPYGDSAASIGVITLKAEDVLDVYRAVAQGLPLVEKTIALCGPCVKKPLHLRARVGTSLNEIVENRLKNNCRTRLILNSLFTGCELSDLSVPIDRSFLQIIALAENKEREFLAFIKPRLKADSYCRIFPSVWFPNIRKCNDTNLHGEERPCVSCGFCDNVCPVNLIPHLLTKYVRRNIIEEVLIKYGIFKCIECGLCSFVCPSKISLLEHIKEGQKKMAAEGFSVKKWNR